MNYGILDDRKGEFFPLVVTFPVKARWSSLPFSTHLACWFATVYDSLDIFMCVNNNRLIKLCSCVVRWYSLLLFCVHFVMLSNGGVFGPRSTCSQEASQLRKVSVCVCTHVRTCVASCLSVMYRIVLDRCFRILAVLSCERVCPFV